MSRKIHLAGWLFERAINFLLYDEDWSLEIKDFSKSKDKKEKDCVGLTTYAGDGGIMYLDLEGGTPTVLIHEIAHVLFGEMLRDEARNMPVGNLKKIKGKNKAYKWEELRILEFEHALFMRLNEEQKNILQAFIDDALERYEQGQRD